MIDSENGILDTLRASLFHMSALAAVRDLRLPQCWIAAGFIRNHVWDILHDYRHTTALNDIDVIYHDAANTSESFEKEQESKLSAILPGLPWSVKNQARMHLKNGDSTHDSIESALARWCETVTPIGARLEDNNSLSMIAPLGLDDLLACRCRATPFARSKPSKLADYRKRMIEKQWHVIWPKVTVLDLD